MPLVLAGPESQDIAIDGGLMAGYPVNETRDKFGPLRQALPDELS